MSGPGATRVAATAWRPMLRTRPSSGGVALRWLTARAVTERWYPQGIEVGSWRGRRLVATSAFRKATGGAHLASRVSLVDAERGLHLDLSLVVDDADGVAEPARIHAGGLAWLGDRLLVAATDRGLWEFDLGAVRRVAGDEARAVVGGSRWPLVRRRLVVPRVAVHALPLRCSFVGRELRDDGTSTGTLLVGEYRAGDGGRLARIPVPDRAGAVGPTPIATWTPGVARMQGAVSWGGRAIVSQSHGMEAGSLWTGAPEALERSVVPLPIGCEDLALDADRRMLWALGEHPWRRVVRSLPLDRVLD